MLVNGINFSARNKNYKAPARTMTKVVPPPACDAVSFGARKLKNQKLAELLKDLAVFKDKNGNVISLPLGIKEHVMQFPEGNAIEIALKPTKKSKGMRFVKEGQVSKFWVSRKKGIRTTATRFSEGHPDYPQGGWVRTKQDLKTGHYIDSVTQINGKERVYRTYEPSGKHVISKLTKNLDVNDKSGLKSTLEVFDANYDKPKSRLDTYDDGGTVLTEYVNGLKTQEIVRDALGRIVK